MACSHSVSTDFLVSVALPDVDTGQVGHNKGPQLLVCSELGRRRREGKKINLYLLHVPPCHEIMIGFFFLVPNPMHLCKIYIQEYNTLYHRIEKRNTAFIIELFLYLL